MICERVPLKVSYFTPSHTKKKTTKGMLLKCFIFVPNGEVLAVIDWEEGHRQYRQTFFYSQTALSQNLLQFVVYGSMKNTGLSSWDKVRKIWESMDMVT